MDNRDVFDPMASSSIESNSMAENSMAAEAIAEILDFWFGSIHEPDYGKPRQVWFAPEPVFDGALRSRFYPHYQLAVQGAWAAWQTSPSGCLALILLLEQLPRNLFRRQPQAFATDPLALAIAKLALAQAFDQALLPVQRWFIYLPFEHSENLADQQQSLDLFARLSSDPDSAQAIRYAQAHFEVIQTFGRFPHRNAILNRTSPPAEEAYLQQPGAGF